MDNLERNKLIAELDEIAALYKRIVAGESLFSLLLLGVGSERLNWKTDFAGATDNVKREVLNKFYNDIASADIVGAYYPHYPPRHWKSKITIIEFGWEKRFNEKATPTNKDKHYKALKSYESRFFAMINEFEKKMAETKEEYLAKMEEYKKSFTAKKKKLLDEKEEALTQLHNFTTISEELYPVAWRISDMLKKGRAETLKEAINLALDEERKDKEEAARREAAARQEAILEQQARDNRMHNEAMQRAAEDQARATREHNAAMERAAQSQADAFRNSEATQQRAAQARCASCANSHKCSYTQKQAYSCASYIHR